jgi:CBS domain containing-hemolysin-like protein
MSSLYASFLVIFLLLVANGFFVAAEFALVKAKKLRIESLANNGNASAKLTVKIQHNMEAYLAACQLGITMASLGLGWVGEPAVAALLEPLFTSWGLPEKYLHTSAFISGFIIFSSLHIVVGEQVPKTIAIRKPEPVSLMIALPLEIFYWIAFPLNWVLNATTSRLLKMFGVKEATHAEVYSGDEIQDLIDVSREHGHLGDDKAGMLQNLFDFDQRTVKEIMVSRGKIEVINLNDPPETWKSTMIQSQHSRYPVIRGNENTPVGILLAKDIYNAMLQTDKGAGWESNIEEFIRPAHSVPNMLKIGSLFESMRVAQAHMALVFDEYGDFSGIITMEDLLEEIVGDIADETDEVVSEYQIDELETGAWRVNGLSPMADIYRATGFKPETEIRSSTISGFLMERFEKLPQAGDSLQENGYLISIENMDRYRVESVHIEIVALSDDEDESSADS